MEIIASTKTGLLIHASAQEINEILTSVTGSKPEKLEIGMKIPAIDYASTIKKIQSLNDDYNFKELCKERISFNRSLDVLISAVNNASLITTV